MEKEPESAEMLIARAVCEALQIDPDERPGGLPDFPRHVDFAATAICDTLEVKGYVIVPAAKLDELRDAIKKAAGHLGG